MRRYGLATAAKIDETIHMIIATNRGFALRTRADCILAACRAELPARTGAAVESICNLMTIKAHLLNILLSHRSNLKRCVLHNYE